jgi:hypothetical protein
MGVGRSPGRPDEPRSHSLTRLQSLVAAEPADLGDQPLNLVDGGLGCRVHQAFVGPGPVRDHYRLLTGQRRPEFLGDERNERMQQAQHCVEHMAEHQSGTFCRRSTSGERCLGQFDIPVAELVPDEVEQRFGELRELEVFVERVDGRGGRVQPGQDPAIRRRQVGNWRQGAHVRTVEQREPGRIPQLVAEVPRGLNPVRADRNIGARVGPAGEGEPDGVGTELVQPLDRVHGVAERLGHLLAVLVAHHAVQRHRSERHRVGGRLLGSGVEAEHHHPGHPEEQDVVPGHQHLVRVELRQRRCVVGPAESRERPQRGGEPGVQDIGILVPTGPGRDVVVRPDAHDLAVGAVPNRDPVPPPQLPGDAPVVHVVDPGEPATLHLGGMDDDPTVADGVTGGLRQRPDPDPPLQ